MPTYDLWVRVKVDADDLFTAQNIVADTLENTPITVKLIHPEAHSDAEVQRLQDEADFDDMEQIRRAEERNERALYGPFDDPYEWREDDRYETPDADYPEVTWPDDDDDGRVEEPYDDVTIDEGDPYQYGPEERDMYDDDGMNGLDYQERYGPDSFEF